MKKREKKERLAIIISLVVITALICIPSINNIFVGIFGYAVYAYMAAAYCFFFFLMKGYKLALPKKKVALYLSIFFSILFTVHIGFTKELIRGGFGSYILDPFFVESLGGTPGGILTSIVTSFIAVPLGYLGSLLLFFFISASLLFFAILPLFIKKDEEAAKQKRAFFQRLLKTTPQAEEKPALEVMKIEEDKPKKPLTVEEFENEPKPKTKEDARKLLFEDRIRPVQRTDNSRYAVQEILSPKEPEKKKNPYEILPNIEASLIKPRDEWYTNSFFQKDTKKAKEFLLNTSLEEDYQSRYGKKKEPKEEKPKTFEFTPYQPEASEQEELNLSRQENTWDTAPIDSNTQPHFEQSEVFERRESQSLYESPPQDLRKSQSLYESSRQEFIQNSERIVEPPAPPKPKTKRPYVKPYVGLLENHMSLGFEEGISDSEYARYKETIESTLKQFGVVATVFNAIKGPTVTRFEIRLEQSTGNSVNKVLNLHKDLKMVLEADGEINILAPIKGKNAIGIEVPNKIRGIVSLRETISSSEFQNAKGGIKLALGKTLEGRPYIADLEEMPHLLVAGATGMGKSVCINTIITSILFRHSPDEVRLLLIDPKKVELINYTGLPHLLVEEPLIEISQIVKALKWIREETLQRFNTFKDHKEVSINEYNRYARNNGMPTIPKIVIVIDEASELMTKAKKEVEETLSSLARIGRAAGVHLIFATQSPTKDVITSEIQNNLNTKIAFAVSDYVHSQVIFKAQGAEKLLGKGDMFLKGSGGELIRIQCSYVSSQEIQRITNFIIQNNEADFDCPIIQAIEDSEPEPESLSRNGKKAKSDDAFMDSIKEALKIGLRMKGLSTSMLQRKMEKGYNSAAKIIDYLEENNYIGAPDAVNRKRKLLITAKDFVKLFPEEHESVRDLLIEE
ncbi:MAG: DNA translocase FtsK [Bacillota bacterium]|nr:DNA translocase FtsK [Bacillota bacterium]